MSIKQFVIGCIIAYFLIGGFLYFAQRHLLFMPFKEKITPKGWRAGEMQAVTFKTKDNLQLTSWYKPPSSKKLTILYLHGNAAHLGYRVPFIRAYMKAGYGVLLVSYRGYADNPGSPSEVGFRLDADAALAFLKEQGIAENNIVVFGESLGTALAVYLASKHQFAGMVLLSAFTSIAKVGQYHYPLFPVKYLIKDKFDSEKLIAKTNTPTLFIHAEKDNIIPFSYGLALYKMLPHDNKHSIVINGKNHNTMTPEEISQPVLKFLDEI